MAGDLSVRLQNLLWWITSIAVSVLCCSVLFVIFASYLVDIKATVLNNTNRVAAVEGRENEILTELEMLRKHAVLTSGQPSAAPAAEVAPADIMVNTPAEAAPVPPSASPITVPLPSASPPALPAVTPPSAPIPPPASPAQK